jgi:hypothetical protein
MRTVHHYGRLLYGPATQMIRPRSQEPGYLVPILPVDRIGRAIGFCLAVVAADLLGLLPERGLVGLVAIRGIAARGTWVAWREAFQALPQVIARPPRTLVVGR